jgi:hypothetical protein
MLLDYVCKNSDRSCKVLDFHQPDSLREMMGHCLDLHEEPQDLEQILSDCKETLKYCVRTGMTSAIHSDKLKFEFILNINTLSLHDKYKLGSLGQ